MADGFYKKPCPGNNAKDAKHDWGTIEKPVYDKAGQLIGSNKFTACRNCGNRP